MTQQTAQISDDDLDSLLESLDTAVKAKKEYKATPKAVDPLYLPHGIQPKIITNYLLVAQRQACRCGFSSTVILGTYMQYIQGRLTVTERIPPESFETITKYPRLVSWLSQENLAVCHMCFELSNKQMEFRFAVDSLQRVAEPPMAVHPHDKQEDEFEGTFIIDYSHHSNPVQLQH